MWAPGEPLELLRLFPGTIRHQPSVYSHDDCPAPLTDPGLTLKQSIASAVSRHARPTRTHSRS